MGSYFDSIENLLTRLSKETGLVFKHRFFNPLSDEKIVYLESKHSVKVSDALKAFYLRSNGFQLAWIAKTSPLYNEVEDFGHSAAWEWGVDAEALKVDYLLELIPLEKAFLRGSNYVEALSRRFEKMTDVNDSELIELQRPDLKYQVLKHVFPYSDKKGSKRDQVNTQFMRKLAVSSRSLTKKEITQKLKEHHLFLDAGGIGGYWKTISMDNGLVIGIYLDAEASEGQQLSLARRYMKDLNLESIDMPYADLCACYGEQLDFSFANLSHSLMTDSLIKNVNFMNSNLSYCDFSRTDFRTVSFQNADLSYCDFENARFEDVDFREAKLTGSSFKGAVLNGVQY